jgi:hypothetical protein
MTGWIPDVVPDQTIESAWGNKIRDRTVTPFANAAARTAAIVTPVTGMLTFLDDTNVTDIWDGAAWRPVLGTGGRAAYALSTAADVAQGTAATVATVSYTPATQRLVKIEGSINYQMVTAGSNSNTYCRLQIDGTPTPTFFATQNSLPVGGYGGGTAVQFATVTAAAHTFGIIANNQSAAGCAMRFVAGQGHVAVYDHGPI